MDVGRPKPHTFDKETVMMQDGGGEVGRTEVRVIEELLPTSRHALALHVDVVMQLPGTHLEVRPGPLKYVVAMTTWVPLPIGSRQCGP